jgi:hypothetical protein
VLQDSYVYERGMAGVASVVTGSTPADGQATAMDEQLDHLDHLAHCQQAMASRQQLGVATGLTAALTHTTADEAWALLVSVSRNANVKVRDVGRVVVRAYTGDLDAEDQLLADRLRPHFPQAGRLLKVGTRIPRS